MIRKKECNAQKTEYEITIELDASQRRDSTGAARLSVRGGELVQSLRPKSESAYEKSQSSRMTIEKELTEDRLAPHLEVSESVSTSIVRLVARRTIVQRGSTIVHHSTKSSATRDSANERASGKGGGLTEKLALQHQRLLEVAQQRNSVSLGNSPDRSSSPTDTNRSQAIESH